MGMYAKDMRPRHVGNRSVQVSDNRSAYSRKD